MKIKRTFGHLSCVAVAIVILPLLLSSCFLFCNSPRSQYHVNDDSTFFSKMPPYSQEGKNIVAFEIDGKLYVYPKAGTFPRIFGPPEWKGYVKESDSRDSTSLFVRVTRWGKKYNGTSVSFFLDFPRAEFGQLSYASFGTAMIFRSQVVDGSIRAADGKLLAKLTHIDAKNRIIAGTFEGILENKYNPEKPIEIKHGFFDVVYGDRLNP